MHHIELTAEEIEVLQGVLQHQIGDMDMEIRHTDTHNFKEMLKRRRDILEQLRMKLARVPVAP